MQIQFDEGEGFMLKFKNKLLQEGKCPVCEGKELEISDAPNNEKEKVVLCKSCGLTIFAEVCDDRTQDS